MKIIGIIVLLIGISGLYKAFHFETTTSFGGEQIVNLGLMSEKLNYIILFIAVSIVGLALYLISRFNDKSPKSLDKSQESLNKTLYEGDRNIADARYQLFLTKNSSIERNITLEKYVIDKDVFDTLDAALEKANHLYEDQLLRQEELHQIEANKVLKRLGDYKSMQMALDDISIYIKKLVIAKDERLTDLFKKIAIGLIAGHVVGKNVSFLVYRHLVYNNLDAEYFDMKDIFYNISFIALLLLATIKCSVSIAKKRIIVPTLLAIIVGSITRWYIWGDEFVLSHLILMYWF